MKEFDIEESQVLTEDFDFGEETEIFTGGDLTKKLKKQAITTNMVSEKTENVCNKCGAHNRLKDKSCVRCDWCFV